MPAEKTKHLTSQEWNQFENEIIARLDIIAVYRGMGIDFVADSPNGSGWVSCWAVGRPHGDSPSAAVNVKSGVYHDFGGLNDRLNLFKFAETYGGHSSWSSARDRFAEMVHVVRPDGKESAKPDEFLKFVPWNDGIMNIFHLWCDTNKPGVTPDALIAAGGRLAVYRGQYTVIALPVYGERLTKADPVGWVIWNSQLLGKDSVLPVFGKNKSVSLVKMKTTAGSESGIIGKHAAEHISQADTIIKTEGPTDLMALMAIAPAFEQSRTVVLTNSAGSNQNPPRWIIDLFAGKRVITVHDADLPGQAGAVKWAQAAARTASESRRVLLPYPIEETHGKDLRDWIRDDGGTWDGLLNLANATPALPPASDEAPRADDDPMRLAEVFLQKYHLHQETELRTLHYWRQQWYQWIGTHWRATSDTQMIAAVWTAVDQELVSLAIEENSIAKDGSEVKAIKVTIPLVNNVLGALKAKTTLPDYVQANSWQEESGQWVNRDWMTLKNGVMRIDEILKADVIGDSPDWTSDLSEYLQEHSPRWFSIYSVPFGYNPNAYAEKFVRIIDQNLEADQERINILQEWTGLMLIPDTQFQKFMILCGEGSNGKSVYFAVLEALLGNENVSHVSLEDFGGNFDLQSTLGKLANISADCDDMENVAEGSLKRFASGDAMDIKRKFKESVNASPTARLIIGTNNLPRFADKSEGIKRRILYIPFRRSVPESERETGIDKHAEWSGRLVGEMPGVLNWAIEGLRRLRHNGRFSNSRVCDEAMAEYERDLNPTLIFFEECIQVSSIEKIAKGKLYDVYVAWCIKNGCVKVGSRKFGKEVFRKFKNDIKDGRESTGSRDEFYSGICLRDIF